MLVLIEKPIRALPEGLAYRRNFKHSNKDGAGAGPRRRTGSTRQNFRQGDSRPGYTGHALKRRPSSREDSFRTKTCNKMPDVLA